jgi:hypothetical protein
MSSPALGYRSAAAWRVGALAAGDTSPGSRPVTRLLVQTTAMLMFWFLGEVLRWRIPTRVQRNQKNSRSTPSMKTIATPNTITPHLAGIGIDVS